ncbi:MAG TPA: methionyl-tRNA formyltransferase [Gemmataceae bacterium]|nr:methionyl-tRNA formyltransferase [Gemmataceae bacterium]
MRVVMMGTGTFAEPTLEALLIRPGQVAGLVTQPDRAIGAQRGSTRQVGRGMKEIAQAAGVPVFQPDSINTAEGVAKLRGWRPDLLVVAAYGQILSKDVLGAARLGGINVHASLLPKYRGAAPVAWAIYHGEKKTGVTIIRMTTGLDAGEMLAQEAIDIFPEETAGELEARLAPQGAKLTLEVLDRMQAGTVAGIPQDKSQATKAPKLKKRDGLIDWSKPAEQVCRQIRAMQPWPTAYTFFRRFGRPAQRVIINLATATQAADSRSATPGQLAGSGHLVVYAGQGAVEVRELQPAGKNRMSGEEFLRGHILKAGDHFGPET